MSKILLHNCCGPCTTYVLKDLREAGHEVTGFFYNPNIRPVAEYERRLLTMEHFATAVGFKVIYEPVRQNTEPGRCANCYSERLRRTALKAKELGFDAFTTTLLISPYQQHDLLADLGHRIGLETGVQFFYRDFRSGFRESQRLAREMKLYRQKYCGCGIDLLADQAAKEKGAVHA